MNINLEDLKAIITKLVLKNNQFSTSAKKIIIGNSFFKSLYIKIDSNPKLQDLNDICKKRLYFIKKYKFDAHLSLAYGFFEKEKIYNAMKNIIIPEYVAFSGISIVKTGRDVEKWETVFQRKF